MASTMKTAHTPGPLTVHRGLDYAVIMRPGETTDSAFVQVRYPSAEDMALLTMLAAAPDMLAALKEILSDMEKDGLETGNFDYAKSAPIVAAIRKAEGR